MHFRRNPRNEMFWPLRACMHPELFGEHAVGVVVSLWRKANKRFMKVARVRGSCSDSHHISIVHLYISFFSPSHVSLTLFHINSAKLKQPTMSNVTQLPIQLISILKSSPSLFSPPVAIRIRDVVTPLLSKFQFSIVVLGIIYLVFIRYFTGLSRIPGPFIASISNLWKINAAWQEDMPARNIALHKKHGPLVRIGPNMISVDEPSAMSVIYGFKPIYRKVSASNRYHIS